VRLGGARKKYDAMRNDVSFVPLRVHAKLKKVASHELQESNKAARDEKTIAEPIEKKTPQDTTKKSGSAKSGSAKNLAAGPGTCCASRRGCAEPPSGDRPTDLGFGHSSCAAIGG